jgi:transcription antitermination factor NusG
MVQAPAFEVERIVNLEVQPAGAWYVVYASVRKEKQAECSLREAGYDAFMPHITQWAKSGRRKYKAQVPLFGRYLFVFVPDAKGFYCVNQCDGVERVIGIAGLPSPIPTKWVHGLRQQQLLGDFDKTIERQDPMAPGTAVKVTVGKWAQLSGVTIGQSEKGRIKVLLEMFGKTHEREFKRSDLEAA